MFTRVTKKQAFPRESLVTARVFTRDDRKPDQGVTYNTKKRWEEGKKWRRDSNGKGKKGKSWSAGGLDEEYRTIASHEGVEEGRGRGCV